LPRWPTNCGSAPARAFDSIDAMLTSGEVDAVWVVGTNDTRIEHLRAINHAVKERGVALKEGGMREAAGA